MSWSKLVHKAWQHNLLVSVLLELTYRCNLDCVFCYNDLATTGHPLSREQYCRILEDLARLQVLQVVLSGGEPLAHPHFFAIGRRARELGFVVRLKSNGHALRGALLTKLVDEVDPFKVEVSLHGATAATHDRQTRVPGSFERLMANLGEMRQLDLRVQLNSTLTRWNEDQLEAMIALAEKLQLPLQIDPEVTPRDDGDRSPLALRASDEALARLQAIRDRGHREVTVQREADALLPASHQPGSPSAGAEYDVGEAPRRHCGAGSSTLAVDPVGNVYPCVQWRRPVGNLHDHSITELWSGGPGSGPGDAAAALEQVRRDNAAARESLVQLGEPARGLGFCPGAAELETGRFDRLTEGGRRRWALARRRAGDDEPGGAP